jgi:hypothetical protein
MLSARSSIFRLDLAIERTQIIAMSWSRVGDVKSEHRRYARIETIDTVDTLIRYVVDIGDECIDFLQLVHTRETG